MALCNWGVTPCKSVRTVLQELINKKIIIQQQQQQQFIPTIFITGVQN
jgi:uncharacterized alpha/beta hydrolase family protein